MIVAVDFDGTIANLDVDWPGLRIALGVEFGRPFPSLSIGYAWVKEEHGTRGQERYWEIVRVFEQARLDRLHGNADILTFIREHDPAITLAVCSSNASETLRVGLSALGIQHSFRCIVSGDKVDRLKPDPEGLQRILHDLDIAFGKALFIGDSEADREAGKAANVRTLILPRFRQV